ncbi:MAG: transcription antitermination factor NusB [Planctomycetota bacterium]|nr:transcription antitermination factor NusB [Planctomycetota bacterium]MEC8337358.1 transcription antitermination factor NusB [Planctomycetota bacterium]
MSRRSRAREVALQVLFQDDLNPCDPHTDAAPFLKQRLGKNSPELFDFSLSLVDGVRKHHAELDGIIESLAAHWSVARMATADRNILRLGVFEMLLLKTPHRIAIDEAIELAKRFGGAQSSQFINGVLDRVWHEKKPTISVDIKAKEEDTNKQINNRL